ncbi:hypothetical protein VB711_00400 [Cronbergia sp. UHCC 0137]|uniref:hypothetical protein n=1 Tax=Cronbergia sp. UHCC 0137 TaxID=3110239 RepID=UPI002B21390F|nr:hypothetical protein [Cronbergia sp. UHCC 0137]MEA5616303.1 hypothetical protein [Cronbergia sp. UHCC 0137]
MQAQTNSGIEKFLSLIDRVSEKQGQSVPQIVEIEKLRSLSTDTFGRIVANFLDANNLKPFTTGPRRKQLHDCVHVLTGYGSDPIGEAEVQAFLLGAKFTVLNLIVGLGLLRMIHRNLQSREEFTWDRLQQAYKRGYDSHFDPDNWQPELLWNLPLTDVQKMFSISSLIGEGI